MMPDRTEERKGLAPRDRGVAVCACAQQQFNSATCQDGTERSISFLPPLATSTSDFAVRGTGSSQVTSSVQFISHCL